ncbi:MAG: hypothetical protein ACYC21_13555, partial [Eubacteriales bacterium]
MPKPLPEFFWLDAIQSKKTAFQGGFSLLKGWFNLKFFEVVHQFIHFNAVYPGSLPDAFISDSASAKAFHTILGEYS